MTTEFIQKNETIPEDEVNHIQVIWSQIWDSSAKVERGSSPTLMAPNQTDTEVQVLSH